MDGTRENECQKTPPLKLKNELEKRTNMLLKKMNQKNSHVIDLWNANGVK